MNPLLLLLMFFLGYIALVHSAPTHANATMDLSGPMSIPVIINNQTVTIPFQPALPTAAAQQTQDQPRNTTEPVEETAAAVEAFDPTQEWFSGKYLNKTEYLKRNYMWIRCRAGRSNIYDVGGSWCQDWGRAWLKELNKNYCSLTNWRFEYKNDLGWGDAEASWTYFWSFTFWSRCNIGSALEAAWTVSQADRDKYRRNMLFFGCEKYLSEKMQPFSYDMETDDWDGTES